MKTLLIQALLAAGMILACGASAPGDMDFPWVAFNDHLGNGGINPNVTEYSTAAGETSSGTLVDVAGGQDTGATLTVSALGVTWEGQQGNPSAGTDAHDIFDGFVDFDNGGDASIALAGADHYTYTFSDLDTADVVTYSFAGTAVRGSAAYTNRWTVVRLEDADGSTPAHSSGDGVVVISPTEAAIWVGSNHEADQGFVAAWTDIDPGSDGDFTIVSQQYTGAIPASVDAGEVADGSKGYGVTGIRLERVVPEPATLALLALGSAGLLRRRRRA